jgi:hypothetical protein
LPILASTGSASRTASALPPTMKVSVPPLAAAIPPETGRVHHAVALCGGSATDARADSTSIVEQSISSAEAGAVPSTCSS